MMKKINQILNVVMGSFIGVFIVYSIYKFYSFKTYPKMYAMQSAPWYISILLYGAFTIVIVIVVLITKYIIRKKMKQ